MDRIEVADVLQDARERVEEAMEEARTALASLEEGFLLDQASAYWLAHVRTALDHEHGYLGGSMVTMQDTIDALRKEDED